MSQTGPLSPADFSILWQIKSVLWRLARCGRERRQAVKLAIAGDIFLGGDLLEPPGEAAGPATARLKSWQEADCRIANLEHPISDSAQLTGMLHAPLWSVGHLREMQVNAVSLANNHSLDMGAEGLADTIAILKRNGIATFGAGRNRIAARAPCPLSEDLCVFGYCNYGRPGWRRIKVATDDSAGVAPLDEAVILEDLEALPGHSKAILFFHWGLENSGIATPRDRRLARRLLGHSRVAMIVGSHAHRYQGSFNRFGKPAFPGLGNFLVPNFHLLPGPRLARRPENSAGVPRTRTFHNPDRLTYIQWPRAARRSGFVVYDIAREQARCILVEQDDKVPLLRKPGRLARLANRLRGAVLRGLYALPDILYRWLAGSSRRGVEKND